MSLLRQALVVDDNEINRILVCRLLSKTGWSVAQAESGEEALEWLSSNTAQLILLDISMPTLSGDEVCRRIRADNLAGDDAKLVAYTAHVMPEEREQFLACGFDTVLGKPVSRQSLAALILDLGFTNCGVTP